MGCSADQVAKIEGERPALIAAEAVNPESGDSVDGPGKHGAIISLG